jgi:hypothetical protein
MRILHSRYDPSILTYKFLFCFCNIARSTISSSGGKSRTPLSLFLILYLPQTLGPPPVTPGGTGTCLFYFFALPSVCVYVCVCVCV